MTLMGKRSRSSRLSSGHWSCASIFILLNLLGAQTVFSQLDTSTPVLSIYQPYQFSTFAGNGPGSVDGTATAARFDAPFGTAVDHQGNIYVADNNNDTIRKVTPRGVVSTFAGLAKAEGSDDGAGSVARFFGPKSLAIDNT